MDPPPLTRFRLRVEIVAPQDGRNISTDPLYKFTIVKTAAIPLPDLNLWQLGQEVVRRFKSIYPGEPPLTIDRFQDSRDFKFHHEDRVQEIFADLDVLRIVQRSTTRASVEPQRIRSASVQVIEFPVEGSLSGQKRPFESPDIHPFGQIEKRRRTSYRDTDRPIRSREKDLDAQKEGEDLQYAVPVQDSQSSLVGQSQIQGVKAHVQVQSSLPVLEVSESIQKIDGIYKDIQSPNAGRKPAAHLQSANSPLGAGKSINDLLTNDLDARPQAKGRPSSNQRIFLYDEGNNVDNTNLTSVAIMTPLSAEQQLDTSLLEFEKKKLKRPNRAATPGRDGSAKTPRAVARKDIYDDIGNDLERPSVKTATPMGRKASSKLKQPSPPAGVSEGKGSGRKGLSSQGGSLHAPRDNVNENNVGQGEANVNREEQRRMNREDQDAVNPITQRAEGLSGIIGKTAEERRHPFLMNSRLKEAQAKELEATVLRAKPANDADEKARENARKETHAKAVAASDARVKYERQPQLQLEVETNKKRKEAQGPNPDRPTRLHKQQDDHTSFKSTAILPNGTSSRVATAYENGTVSEVDSDVNVVTPKSSHLQATPASQRSSSTAFNPQRRSSGMTSAAMISSQTIGGSSPAETSTRRLTQTPVPPPTGVKRKVSILEPQPQPRAAPRTSTPSSSLKQTTLVEPRLGYTNGKGILKRNVNKAVSSSSESSRSNKGKAKVIQSHAKQPEVIVISDSELSAGVYNEDDFRGVGEPGPAYQKNLRRPSSKTSQLKVDGSDPKEAAILPKKSFPSPYSDIVKLESESSSEPSSPSPAKSHSAVLMGRPSPQSSRSRTNRYSPILPPGAKGRTVASHANSSQFTDNSPAKIAAARLNDVIHDPVAGTSNTPSNVVEVDGMSEDEMSQEVEGEQDSDDDSEDDDDDDVGSDKTGEDGSIKHDQVMADSNELTGEESTGDGSSSEDEADEGDQMELDSQPTVPTRLPDSRGKKPLDTSTYLDRSITKNQEAEETERRRELSTRNPGLQRITQEAKKIRDADKIAASARSVTKAQEERDAARQVSEREGTDEDFMDQSSSNSENDEDDEETETNMVPMTTPLSVNSERKAMERSRSSALLGSEDVEDMKKVLQPNIAARTGTSSQGPVDPRSPQVNGGPRKASQSSRKTSTMPLKKVGAIYKVKNKSSARG